MPKIKFSRQFSPVQVNPKLPTDPALRAVLDDVLDKLRYAFTIAATGEKVSAKGSVDKVFETFLKSRSATARDRYKARASALLSAPKIFRADHFGRLADLDAAEYRRIGSDGISGKVSPVEVDRDLLVKNFERYRDRLVFGSASNGHSKMKKPFEFQEADKPNTTVNQDLVEGQKFKKIRLFINRVECHEETDGVFEGSDEINLGGTKITPLGETFIVDQFEVSDDFDEGEVANFGMSKKFAGWNIQTKPDGFPYVYTAVIAMAEKDDGGFYQFLRDLWDEIDEEVKTAVVGLIGAAIGGAIGGIIGSIVGLILGVLIAWLIELFDNPDDIVDVNTVWITLASAAKSYYEWANLTTGQGWKTTLRFNGEGGRYEVDCSFKAFAQ